MKTTMFLVSVTFPRFDITQILCSFISSVGGGGRERGQCGGAEASVGEASEVRGDSATETRTD